MPQVNQTAEPALADVRARVRAKAAARYNMTAHEYLSSLLHATCTSTEAAAILDRFERETPTATRLSRVLDICDETVRAGGETVDVDRVHAAALGDDVRKSGGAR